MGSAQAGSPALGGHSKSFELRWLMQPRHLTHDLSFECLPGAAWLDVREDMILHTDNARIERELVHVTSSADGRNNLAISQIG